MTGNEIGFEVDFKINDNDPAGAVQMLGSGTITRLSISGIAVAENGTGGELAGTLSMIGTDFTAPVTYTITSDPSLKFEISGTSLDELHVKASTTIDFESNPTFPVGLRATDSTAGTPLVFDLAATVVVTNVNEAPTDIVLSASSIPENTLAGSIIGTLSTVDIDNTTGFTYSIDLDADAKFAISGDSLIVRAGAAFDYETKTSHAVTIRSTDAGGLSFAKIFTIQITDILEAITDITLSPSSVVENIATGSTIGTLTSTSVNVGTTFTYAIILDADSKFAISGDQLNARAGVSFDFEAAQTHVVTVRSTSVANPAVSFDKIVTVTVTDINEAPTNITVATGSLTVPDTTVDGTTIVTLATTDPDTGDTFTYSQITVSSDFETTAAGALKVKTGAALAAGTYPITVRSTDSGGLTKDVVFSIVVTASAGFQISDLTATYEEYDGRLGVTLGTGVQNWADQGPNGNDLAQLTGANQPAYNGVDTLSFDGANDYMSVPAPMSAGVDVHLFVVAALYTGQVAYERFVSHLFSNSDYQFADRPILLEASSTFGDTKVQISSNSLANEAQSAAGAIDNTTKLIHSSVVAGVGSISINSVAGGTTTTVSTPLAGTDLVVGSGYTISYGKMDLNYLLYVRGAMTAQEIIDVETLIKADWGL